MKTDWMKSLSYLFPAVFLLAVIQYASDNYSPVPFWDTWDGFMRNIKWGQEGYYTKILSQHNEHRIVLSRLLFLFDYHVLKSHFSALIAANVVLMLASFGLLIHMSRKYLGKLDAACIGLVGCLVLLLTQAENIRWEFQSQWFFAQIIPLIAFILFFNAMGGNKTIKISRSFWVAMLFAMLANFTMGNGFLASIIILAALLLLKSSKTVKCSVAAVAAFSVGLMLANRTATGSLGGAFEHFDLIACAKYLLIYLGSPFYHVFQFYGFGKLAGYLSSALGLAFIFSFVGYGWFLLKKKHLDNKYALALLCMALYVILSACLAAITRYQYGIGQATSERYTTPVLTGWAAMLVVLWPLLKERLGKVLEIAAVACMLALLPYQQLAAKKKIDDFY